MFIEDENDGSEPTSATQSQDPDLKHPIDFITAVKIFLKEYGVTQEELALIAGVSEKSVNNWMCNRHDVRDEESVLQRMQAYERTHARQVSMFSL